MPYLLMDGSKYQEKESQEISPRSASYATEPMMKDQLPTQVAAQPAPVASPATKPPTPEVNVAPMPVSAGGVSGKSLPQVMTGISQTLPRPGTQSKVVTAEDRSSANRERVLKMSNRVVTDKVAAQRLLEHAVQSKKTQARSLFKFAAADYDVEYNPEYVQEVPQEEYMPQYEQAAVQNYYPGYDAYSNYMSYSPSSQQMYYSPAAASADFRSYENMYATPEPSAQADYAPMEEAAPAPAPAPTPGPQPTEEELQLAAQEVERQQMVQAYQQSLSEIVQYLVNVGYPPEEAAKYAPTLLGQVGITNPAQVKTASRFAIARPGMFRGAWNAIKDLSRGTKNRDKFVQEALENVLHNDPSYRTLRNLVSREGQLDRARRALAGELNVRNTNTAVRNAVRAEALANATAEEARLLEAIRVEASRLGGVGDPAMFRAPRDQVLRARGASSINDAVQREVADELARRTTRIGELSRELQRSASRLSRTVSPAERQALQLQQSNIQDELTTLRESMNQAGIADTRRTLEAAATANIQRDIALQAGMSPTEINSIESRLSRLRGELATQQDLIANRGPSGSQLRDAVRGRRQRYMNEAREEAARAQTSIDDLEEAARRDAVEAYQESIEEGRKLIAIGGPLVGIPVVGGLGYGIASAAGLDPLPQSPTDKVLNTASNLINDPKDTIQELGSSAGSALSSGYQKAKNVGQSVADYAADKGLTPESALDWADKNKEDLILAGLTVGGLGLGASALSRRGKSSPAPGQGPFAPASSPTRIW